MPGIYMPMPLHQIRIGAGIVTSMESASVPYGRRLVPNVIDETAQHEPHREAFQIPRSEEARDGWEVITFKHYANAINVRAHAFVKLCGKPRENTFPTLAYIGPQDARYVVFMVAAMKAGFKVGPSC